jgi:hypothetical protein
MRETARSAEESLLNKLPKVILFTKSYEYRHIVRARKCVREDRVAEGVPAP